MAGCRASTPEFLALVACGQGASERGVEGEEAKAKKHAVARVNATGASGSINLTGPREKSQPPLSFTSSNAQATSKRVMMLFAISCMRASAMCPRLC